MCTAALCSIFKRMALASKAAIPACRLQLATRARQAWMTSSKLQHGESCVTRSMALTRFSRKRRAADTPAQARRISSQGCSEARGDILRTRLATRPVARRRCRLTCTTRSQAMNSDSRSGMHWAVASMQLKMLMVRSRTRRRDSARPTCEIVLHERQISCNMAMSLRRPSLKAARQRALETFGSGSTLTALSSVVAVRQKYRTLRA
mmetsp:Transcript_152269/g.291667  ORF Transcript_152269/g.291667 Transcript_152269/m.291667 type:complete len:206 (+) Transcript_152269:541-1158(+)